MFQRTFTFDGDTERTNWDLLAKRASKMFKRSPAMSYMYGSFKPTELPRKEPKERVRRQAHKAVGEKKEPEKVRLFVLHLVITFIGNLILIIVSVCH